MTVSDKLFELNKQFQISYHDEDSGFYEFVAPDLINQIKTFLTAIINEQHPLNLNVSKHIKLLNQQIKDMLKLSENTTANNWVKDKWLNSFKSNVAFVCGTFRHECWNFDEKILNQIV